MLSPYRGQNANMHACEAMLAAWEATHDPRHLDRAEVLARATSHVRQAALAGDAAVGALPGPTGPWTGTSNRHDRTNIFRPLGTPARSPDGVGEAAPRPRAAAAGRLAAAARGQPVRHWRPERAWDSEHGGLVYGFAPDGSWCDDDKYFWVQAESLAAAASLAVRTGDQTYWDWYERIWSYARGTPGRSRPRRLDTGSDARQPEVLGREEPGGGRWTTTTLGACWDVLGVVVR